MAHYYACKFGLNRLRIDGDIGQKAAYADTTTVPQRYRQTDGRTDIQTTYCSNAAMHIVQRAIKIDLYLPKL